MPQGTRGGTRVNMPVAVAFCLLLALIPTLSAAQLQYLKGHVPDAVAASRPNGFLPATNYLRLAIGLPLRNRTELTNLLAQIYNSASTNYHHFLTSTQFVERFGPTVGDYQSVQAFARANGLQVTGTHANRTLLDVTAPVSQIEQAFHVHLRLYPHPREARNFYAPDTEPSLNLSVPILHISGLDNFIVPQPMNLRKTPLTYRSSLDATNGSGPEGSYWGNDFRNAYVPGTVMTGLGQKVALLQFDSGFYQSDITNYENEAGLPNVPVTPVFLDGYGGGPGFANDECSLDIEMAISMAPGLSQVLVYEGTLPDDILNQMAADDSAQQLSSSYAFSVDPSTEQTFQQFAAQGQSFFNASGDGNAWVGGVAPPSDDPNITIVGGTTLSTGTNGVWLSERVWRWNDTNGSGGGISTQYPIPYWQQGVDMTENQGSTSMRNIPDVALTADNVFVAFGDGTNGVFGGTSCAAPLWAGFTALMNQQAANNSVSSVGFVNPTIYNLGQAAGFTNLFHDITTGNNTNDLSDNLFVAVPGYDLCTGWGTPAGQSLIDAMVGPASPTPVYIITQPQSQTVTTGTTVTFSVLPGGLPPFSYQWSLNGTNLMGATNEFLVLDDVQTNQAGNYEVLVTNDFGSAYSSTAVLAVNQPLPCDPDPSGLISWWPGQDNANDIIGSNNGILEGSVSFAPGEVGQGFLFTDPSDDVRIPASPSLDVGSSTGSFTVEAWINCSTTSQLNPIFEWNTGDGTTLYGLHFYVWSDGTLYANLIDTSGFGQVMHPSPVVITAGTFYHVALTYDYASGNATIYCDGNVVSQENVGQFTPQTSYDLYLGRRPLTLGETYTFAGVLDEPSLYNRALSAPEILAIYNAGSGGKCGPSPTPPVILDQPTNQIVDVGSNVVFSVGASGLFPLNYQWMFNQTNLIAGATNSVLTLTNVQLSEAGLYSVTVSNSLASVDSSNAVLTVVAFPPAIQVQPTNETAIVGSTATLSVVASGSPPLSFQWEFQGTNLVGATNATLQLTDLQISQLGTYDVLVTNQFGSVLSSNAILTVVGIPPAISLQPASQTARQGNLAVFEVNANGTAPLYYQWLFQGTILNGATNAYLSLQNVQFNQGGIYNVFVFNAFGSLVSSNAVLTIQAPPAILAQPTNQTVLLGSNPSFGVIVTGSLPIAYRWFFNGTNLANATNSTITLTNVTALQAGNYSVQASNSFGQVLSSSAVLAFFVPPKITTQPVNLNVRIGTTATFTVTATGATNIVYQWYWNTNILLAQATNATLTLTNVQTNNIGAYFVVITNIAGSATSSNAVLFVNPGYHFAWAPIPSPRFVNVPFTTTIQAQNISNVVVTNFSGTLNFSSSLGIPVQPPVSGPFVRGNWTGKLTVGQPATNLVLQASDGIGDTGSANSINIVPAPYLYSLSDGYALLMFWPTNLPGFVIETSPKLDSTNWTPLSSQTFGFGNTNVLFVPLTGTNAFFRLWYTNP
jgi:hypothetical protein